MIVNLDSVPWVNDDFGLTRRCDSFLIAIDGEGQSADPGSRRNRRLGQIPSLRLPN